MQRTAGDYADAQLKCDEAVMSFAWHPSKEDQLAVVTQSRVK